METTGNDLEGKGFLLELLVLKERSLQIFLKQQKQNRGYGAIAKCTNHKRTAHSMWPWCALDVQMARTSFECTRILSATAKKSTAESR